MVPKTGFPVGTRLQVDQKRLVSALIASRLGNRLPRKPEKLGLVDCTFCRAKQSTDGSRPSDVAYLVVRVSSKTRTSLRAIVPKVRAFNDCHAIVFALVLCPQLPLFFKIAKGLSIPLTTPARPDHYWSNCQDYMPAWRDTPVPDPMPWQRSAPEISDDASLGQQKPRLLMEDAPDRQLVGLERTKRQ